MQVPPVCSPGGAARFQLMREYLAMSWSCRHTLCHKNVCAGGAVTQCRPDVAGIHELQATLNADRNFGAFVKAVRREFKALAD